MTQIMEIRCTHTYQLNTVYAGDRRSDRGERNELQISANFEKDYGLALSTCLKVYFIICSPFSSKCLMMMMLMMTTMMMMM